MKVILKKEKGITLIALVVTIVVLLILAGVSISMLTGENGIIKQAQDAKEETRISGLEEELRVKFEDSNILITLEKDEESEELKDVEILGSSEDEKGIFYTVVYKDERFKAYYNEDTGKVYDVKYFKLLELHIYTYDELVDFANRVNNGENFQDYIVYLENDIDLKEEEWNMIGRPQTQIEPAKTFAGIFEGKEHTIYGMSKTDISDDFGLFCYNSGTIQNLNVRGKVNDSDIDGYISGLIGGIVATNDGIVKNCNAEIDIAVTFKTNLYYNFVGGIVGRNEGTIIDCTSKGEVKAVGDNLSLGGISGQNANIIEGCVNEANVIINEQENASLGYDDNNGNAGGITGENRSEVVKCINKAEVRGNNYYIGGIVGTNYSKKAIINECANLGDFKTTYTSFDTYSPYIAGICAYNREGVIMNCYNIGNGRIYVSENGKESRWSHMAGIVARNTDEVSVINCYTIGEIPSVQYSSSYAAIDKSGNESSEYSNCYFNTETCIANDEIAVGLTSEEMKNADFVSRLGESFIEDTNGINNGYPIFKWQ